MSINSIFLCDTKFLNIYITYIWQHFFGIQNIQLFCRYSWVRQSIKSKSDCRCGGRTGTKPPPITPTVAHGIAYWLLRERRQGIVPQFSACFGKNRNVKSSFSSRCLKKAFDLACKVVKAYDRILSCFLVWWLLRRDLLVC